MTALSVTVDCSENVLQCGGIVQMIVSDATRLEDWPPTVGHRHRRLFAASLGFRRAAFVLIPYTCGATHEAFDAALLFLRFALRTLCFLNRLAERGAPLNRTIDARKFEQKLLARNVLRRARTCWRTLQSVTIAARLCPKNTAVASANRSRQFQAILIHIFQDALLIDDRFCEFDCVKFNLN